MATTETYWTRELIIERIQQWAEEHDGRQPTANEWFEKFPLDENGHRPWPPTATVVRLFGSWSEGIEAAGFKPLKSSPRTKERHHQHKRPVWDREQIIAEIQKWHAEHRLPPTKNDWEQDKNYTDPNRVVRTFGTWGNAIREAGFVPRAQGVSTKSIQKLLPLPRMRDRQKQTTE